MSFITGKKLNKIYGTGDAEVHALKDADFEIKSGEFLSIMGESGSGKSTLLSLLGAMNGPTSGTLTVDDIDLYSISIDQRADFRREYLGFVFQSFHLIPYLTVVENVMLPLTTVKMGKKKKREQAEKTLIKIGLGDKINRLPNEISGGQKERVAIARAMVNEPPILLADEPTGNLDTATSHEIMKQLTELNNDGMTIIMVTHSYECAEYANRILEMTDGEISNYKINKKQIS